MMRLNWFVLLIESRSLSSGGVILRYAPDANA